MRSGYSFRPVILLFCAMLFLAFCFDISAGSIKTASFAFLLVCTVIGVCAYKSSIPAFPIFMTYLTGAFLKLSYMIYTPVWCRQHDVIDFGAGEGHAAYIEYILAHKALPDFDPRTVWAFFQPPLHHLVAAVWMWLGIRCGITPPRLYKNVQILPFIYMCMTMYIIYMICRELDMKKQSVLITMLIVSFHPIYILMSASLNNDALSVMLSVAALYTAIRWYKKPGPLLISALALVIGSSMSAKLSSVLTAIGIGPIMIYKIVKDTGAFRDKDRLLKHIRDLFIFALIVFPLGLWWTVRNSILFNMPPTYIPEVGEQVEKFGIVPTFLDLRTASPFLYMKANGYGYDEYNLILATVKSSLFGEGDFARISPYLTMAGWILLAAAAISLTVRLASFIRMCAPVEGEEDKGIRLMLVSVFAVSLIGYLAFALSGKNLSAMNFRYCAAAAAVLPVCTGLWYDMLYEKGKKGACALIMISSAAFALSSLAFYILLGLL